MLLKQYGGPKSKKDVHSNVKQNGWEILQSVLSELVEPLWAFAQKLYANLLEKESLLVEDG